MRRIYKFTFIAVLISIFCLGCTHNVLVTSYYLLEYQPHATNPDLMLDKPLLYRVQVVTFKIPRSYDSIRIIARYSSHQINYYRYSLWAVRPQVAVADMLVQHINTYQIFRDCQREFLDERPEYEISGEITQIERFESENFTAAHIKMSFELSDYESNERLVTYTFDREVPITTGEITIFAKAVSDIIAEEAEVFLEKVVRYFASLETESTTGSK